MNLRTLIIISFIGALVTIIVAVYALFRFFDTPIAKGEAHLIMELGLYFYAAGISSVFFLVGFLLSLVVASKQIIRAIAREIVRKRDRKIMLKVIKMNPVYIPEVKDDPGLKVVGGFND